MVYHRSSPRQLSVTESSVTLPPKTKGTSTMAHYRAYLVGQDSYFIKAVDLDCEDDAAARKRAQKMVDGHDVELWQHARRIAKFEHGSK
jgi:hypothetical protein